jgi:hypothetical protein
LHGSYKDLHIPTTDTSRLIISLALDEVRLTVFMSYSILPAIVRERRLFYAVSQFSEKFGDGVFKLLRIHLEVRFSVGQPRFGQPFYLLLAQSFPFVSDLLASLPLQRYGLTLLLNTSRFSLAKLAAAAQTGPYTVLARSTLCPPSPSQTDYVEQ